MPSRNQVLWIILFLLCVLTRAATAIYYLADPDSMRFALGVIDFDVTRLQPHFPGYPVFIAIVKPVFALAGSYAMAFALVGGVATWVVIRATLSLAGEQISSLRGSLLVVLLFCSPMIWQMGVRYMPDLAGLACALAAMALLLRTPGHSSARVLQKPGRRLRKGAGDEKAREDTSAYFAPFRPFAFSPVQLFKKNLPRITSPAYLAGWLLAGLLPGIRLSYLPLLLVPVAVALVRDQRRLRSIAAGTLGVLLWLVPFVLVTGVPELFEAAQVQTSGHFGDFGGTVLTEPDFLHRLVRTFESIFADGLGGYWPGRHPVTIAISVLCFGGLLMALRRVRNRPNLVMHVLAASVGVYLLWILFFQNIIHQNRHVMPLLPFVIMAIAAGLASVVEWRRQLGTAVITPLVCCYIGVGAWLAWEHRKPTAIAQATEYLRQQHLRSDIDVAGVPLVTYMLSSQGIDARFHDVESAAGIDSLAALNATRPIITVGDLSGALGRRYSVRREFFHNPYLNRVWPEVVVMVYPPGSIKTESVY